MGASGADRALRFAGRTSSDPARAVSRWKSFSEGKAAGCLPLFIPEEILHAAGMLPVTVCGDEYEKGSPPRPWEVLDGWVLPPVPCLPPETVDHLLAAAFALPRISLYLSDRSMKVPSTEDALDQVEQLREWAGDISGRPATEGALQKSISIFNENRRLSAVLEGRLASDPGAYSAREVCWLSRAAMVLPPEAHTELLRAALSRGPISGRRPRFRVFLGGVTADLPAMEVIDGAGAVLVGEAVASGLRKLDAMAEEEGDPALALARRLRRQLLGLAEAAVDPSWAGRLLDRVEESGADRFLYLGGGADSAGHSGKLAPEAGSRGIPFLFADRDPASEYSDRRKEKIARFLASGD